MSRQGTYLYFLPAYSPELNRIEPVFKQVKHHDMPTRSFTTRADLRKAVVDGFDAYRRRLAARCDDEPRLSTSPGSVVTYWSCHKSLPIFDLYASVVEAGCYSRPRLCA